MAREFIVTEGMTPIPMRLFGCPVMVGVDLLPSAVNAKLSAFGNAISGGFSNTETRRPGSILWSWGKRINGFACHAHNDKPESVLYRLTDGTVGIKRCTYDTELPAGVRWAIGGMGLVKQFDPVAEGFTGKYGDVERKTAHTFVGFKDGLFYAGYVDDMTAAEVNEFVKRLGLEYAVMLDGGGWAAINTMGAAINLSHRQFNIVQVL